MKMCDFLFFFNSYKIPLVLLCRTVPLSQTHHGLEHRVHAFECLVQFRLVQWIQRLGEDSVKELQDGFVEIFLSDLALEIVPRLSQADKGLDRS